MTTYPIIKKADFIDLNKTRVRVLLEDEGGRQTVAELGVPKDRALGQNEIWDRIVSEFDVEEMSKRRNNVERKRAIEKDLAEKKKKATIENDILRNLFNNKLYYFNLPFIDELTDEEKSAIRRAPNVALLNAAVAVALINYTQRTGKTFTDLFDEIEDKEFEEVNNKK